MEIRTFQELRERAKGLGARRVAVVSADDEVALSAAAEALHLGLALPVLVGDLERIRELAKSLGLSLLLDRAEFVDAPNAAAAAVHLVRASRAEILLKGHLRTDELLRAVLHKEDGLRTGRLLSDVMLFQYGNGEQRLVGVTDGGLNVAPNLEQKMQIVENAIEVIRSLGIARPRIAIMSATEAVSDAVPSTKDAQALTAMGAGEPSGTRRFTVRWPWTTRCWNRRRRPRESTARWRATRTVWWRRASRPPTCSARRRSTWEARPARTWWWGRRRRSSFHRAWKARKTR